jgi:hypothetical protein
MHKLIAEAHAAIAEAHAIVKSARRYYGITGHSHVGPLTRAFQRRAAPPPPTGPDYYLDERELADAHAVVKMLALAKLPTMRHRATAYYRAAGLYLARLRSERDRCEFAEITRHECALGLRRAYQLIALAEGRGGTLEQLRAADRARKQKARSSQTNSEAESMALKRA